MDTTHNPYLQPLRLKVSIPASIYILIILIHLPAIIMPWLTSLPTLYKLMVSLGVCLSLAMQPYLSQLLKTARRVSEIVLDQSDSWQIRTAAGEILPSSYGTRHFVHPKLTLVELRQQEQVYRFVFTSANTSIEQSRHLRTRLKHRVAK